MMIRWNRFNIYLMLALVLGLAGGCKSLETKRKEATARLSINLEVSPGGPAKTQQVPVYRENPVLVNIHTEPFLTDANVLSAKVVNDVGGFSLQIQLDRDGTILLEQRTVANRGRRYVIYCKWGVPPKWELNEGRWLAAPQFTHRITNGLLVFTPDTTREEAEQIAIGLTNVGKAAHDTPGFE
jgi:hypothetical protein